MIFEVVQLYKRIRDLREMKNMTQSQIAAYLNCSQRIYSNYERGDVDIPTRVLIQLADLHNTSTDYLLNRTDLKEPYPPSKKRK
ncbi:helix-turn-helix transcriptional regulator [Paenibacillus thiaminolyticus]|uniref:helix-turn-helix domain-containing protein n=1 Tax=Paenibacillus thiaminolyticus TaxID=49283 RepID=UPI0035A639CE